MPSLYTGRVTSTGGRNGHITSDDGMIDMDITVPPSLGGKGDKPNPELLFAAGYAACFGNAVIFVAKDKGIELAPEDVKTTAEVELFSTDAGEFRLRVHLDNEIKGVDQAQADELVKIGHEVCPYSNATRGNIEVTLSAKAV
ncbi:MAG: Ohr subfamily peroxiredoxin [Phycisphaerae bacterium]|nr:Ohr subfamily peroxiredoxin [Phycisphaerae bacterium]MBM92842.1 Ohr subfamily peroxiredoxin [Phycisphaerae bacterium]HCT43712.1 Ohr subfamily peroxiredoxin [Phycisphaerales bacterium]